MKQYRDLTYLHLKRTKIHRLPAKIFSFNAKLRTIDLEYTPLESIDDQAFYGVEISNLNLKGTQISHLPGQGMKFVQKLNIRNVENLWKLPYKDFQHLQEADVEYHFHCCLFKQTLENAVRPTPRNVTVIKTCPPVETVLPTTRPTTRPTTPPTTDIFDKHPIPNFNDKRNYSHTFPPDKCAEPDIKIHTAQKIELNCRPLPDAFNPCEDLLGSKGLRVCTWFVLVFALLGNVLQLTVLVTSKRNNTMYKILMCNLSGANLLLAVYLTMLAVTDARSCGEYQNYARAWQYGPGCRVAGFLSILSTELAVFILTVITVERYFTIVHPLKLHMHLSTQQIVMLVLTGWVFALVMAVLPIFNVSSYQKVAICLPFDVETDASKAYVSFLLITNGLAFIIVLYCYARMYCSLGGASSSNRIELRVAKKMAVLVLSNFACWFPIALFSFIAIYGSPVIDVSTSKFLLVFIFPINAFTNPYLYALGTKHFQLDLLDLVKNFGVCHSEIEKLRSRLLDQLASSVPNSSRAYIHGSRTSVNLYRSPSHVSMNNSPKNSKNSSPSRSFSLHFLSIPSIKFRSCRDDRKSSTDRSTFGVNNELSSDSGEVEFHAQPLLEGGRNGSVRDLEACRRMSARETILGGTGVSKKKLQATVGLSNGDCLNKGRPKSTNCDSEEINQQMISQNKVPVVMVTSC